MNQILRDLWAVLKWKAILICGLWKSIRAMQTEKNCIFLFAQISCFLKTIVPTPNEL